MSNIAEKDRASRSVVKSAPIGVSKRRFRFDIQALRAAAVMLVVLNHLWPTRVAGGYVGVDVFFVISGYLITAHLRREGDATGRIKLSMFWARRAKRLLPAAFVTLIFVIIATVLWAPATVWQSTMGQVAAAATYVLNWILAASSLNYFAAGDAGTPVTHYWSLSVEEQFYLVWPLLIVACLFLSRSRTARTRNAMIVSIFIAVLVGSFVGALLSIRTEPSAAYFETYGRAWEFAAGGLLTFIPRLPRKALILCIPLVWIAWGALGAAAFRLGPASGVPGWAALLPVGATVVIIWVGDLDHSWAPTGITSLGPVQFIGDISYSLYLWHWPLIFVLPMILHHEATTTERVGILVASIGLAYLSKRYIEDPVRKSTVPVLSSARWVLIGTALSMIVLLFATYAVSEALNSRITAAAESLNRASKTLNSCFGAQAVLSGAVCAESHTLRNLDSALVDRANQVDHVPNGTRCISTQGDSQVRACTFGAKAGTQVLNVALVGDSHADVWVAALAAIAEKSRLRVTTYLESGCPPTLDENLKYGPATSQSVIDGCRSWRDAVIARVTADPSIDVVVTSSKDRSYVNATDDVPDTGAGYVAVWKGWLSAGKRVVVINDVPDHVRTIVPSCIEQSDTREDPCAMSASAVARPGPLAQAASHFADPEFRFVDFQKVFCDQLRCHSVIGGIPAYIDPSHITPAFARSFAPEFQRIALLQR